MVKTLGSGLYIKRNHMPNIFRKRLKKPKAPFSLVWSMLTRGTLFKGKLVRKYQCLLQIHLKQIP